MRFFREKFVWVCCLILGLISCVDQVDKHINGIVNVIVIDGTITNLNEPQIVRLNRSKADSLTGRPGSTPIAKATVEIVVDSVQVVTFHETLDGTYQAPSNFVGQVGHTYQLRFTLSDGNRYVSTQQVMQTVPSISRVSTQFNPASLGPTQRLQGVYAAAHDFYVDTQDPAVQHNYYRWDWKLYEKQEWCHTCLNGLYLVWDVTETYIYENCYDATVLLNGEKTLYDYACRSNCWDIFYNSDIVVFDDQSTNGNPISHKIVAQIPFYQYAPCLVEIRQIGLTQAAYQYYKILQDQTQNTGGLADTPPSPPLGNMHNVANSKELIVGYFSAGAVSSVRHWLNRKDAQGIPPGLFQVEKGREPQPEPTHIALGVFFPSKRYSRPPTALCLPSDSRTPFKPEGWRD